MSRNVALHVGTSGEVDMDAVAQVRGKPIDHEYTLFDLLRRRTN